MFKSWTSKDAVPFQSNSSFLQKILLNNRLLPQTPGLMLPRLGNPESITVVEKKHKREVEIPILFTKM